MNRYRPGTGVSPIPIDRNEDVRERRRGAGGDSREGVPRPGVWPRSAASGAFDKRRWQVGFPDRTKTWVRVRVSNSARIAPGRAFR